MPLMGTTSNLFGGNTNTTAGPGASIAGSPAYVNAAASGGSHMSEFGSGGGGGVAVGSIGRAPEGSSRATSPSLSPTIGGTQATFPSTSTSANQSISQSFQASTIDSQSLHSATNSTFTVSNASTFPPSSLSAGQVSQEEEKRCFTIGLLLKSSTS